MLRVPNCSGFIVGNAHIIPEYALYESFALLPPFALRCYLCQAYRDVFPGLVACSHDELGG